MNRSELELYTTKELLPFDNGIPIIQVGNFEDRDSLFKSRAKFDTINNQIIYAGAFQSNFRDLEKVPILNDSDILGFDFESNELLVSSASIHKLNGLDIHGLWKKQFVLTANKEKILSGYLCDSMGACLVNDNYIYTFQSRRVMSNDTVRLRVDSVSTQDYRKDYSKNSKFFNAFKER
ncbi:hypothetical protein BST97_15455 [Nonlabens spongiae]|uniref:Uncharacterized protein n=1 Tax=Nonlabens spongiae TaxID=331648 RepID=A0A1W6MNT6_9FLAO|nr:hypothetical protein [Nonlabens spongiae]ARN79268.1 hypothetical protein BST97_15455 [Nonlabens spongiae]